MFVMAECEMCGRTYAEHSASVETWEVFGALYCEFCAEEAFEEEAQEMAQ